MQDAAISLADVPKLDYELSGMEAQNASPSVSAMGGKGVTFRIPASLFPSPHFTNALKRSPGSRKSKGKPIPRGTVSLVPSCHSIVTVSFARSDTTPSAYTNGARSRQNFL